MQTYMEISGGQPLPLWGLVLYTAVYILALVSGLGNVMDPARIFSVLATDLPVYHANTMYKNKEPRATGCQGFAIS